MKEIFDNECNPYNEATKNQYHQAIKDTLLNIQKLIQKTFNLTISFDNQDDTWQMGKTLSSILFPQSLEGDNVQNFISLLKKYNLNLDEQFFWLKGDSLLSNALDYYKFELADALISIGAKIPFIPRLMANSNILNWFIWNEQKIYLDYQDCAGKTVLDYAKDDAQLIKTLIANAEIYPANLAPQCYIKYECPTVDSNSETTLNALAKLLIFYNQNEHYDRNNEDAEFIVRLPEIIAAELYQDEIIEIFQPLAEYWQEVISPAAAEYLDKHDMSDICLPLVEYAD